MKLPSSFLKRLFFLTFLSLGLAANKGAASDGFKAPPGVPVDLKTGLLIEFEQSGMVTFPNTDDRAAILMFWVRTENALKADRLADPTFQQELHDHTVEICNRFGKEHISAVRRAHPGEKFKYVAVQLKFPTGQRGKVLTSTNWTSMYNIAGNQCGTRLVGSK